MGATINYNIRPAKSIERKMLCESFRCIRKFNFPSSYRYIGFGAKYFTDFILFHKELCINDMVSMEKNTSNRQKYEFNKPLKCIKIEFGKSTDVLPKLEWPEDKKTILWLDYDQKFQPFMMNDVKMSISNITSGSIILISCNRVIGNEMSDYTKESRLDYLKGIFEDKVPITTKERDLVPKYSFKIVKEIFDDTIKDSLYEVNSTRNENDKLNYEQLFYFIYSDGAPMVTIGGIFFQEKDRLKYEKCTFSKNPFIGKAGEPYDIDIPCLTLKEVQALNSMLPIDNIDDIKVPGLKREEIEKYIKLYRYFPYFTEMQTL